MHTFPKIFLLLISIYISVHGAELSVCGLFSDHMVLQEHVDNHVWGTAKPGQEIALEIDKHQWTCKSNTNGAWSTKIPALNSGWDYTLRIKAETQIEIKHVAVGEVWVAGGQSNMQFGVGKALHKTEAQTACDQSKGQLRIIKIPQRVSQTPLSDVNAKWVSLNKQNCHAYSAVAVFYAAQLQQKLNKPIGIIQCCIGGTVAETWMSPAALQHDKYQALHVGWEALLKEWYPGIDPRKVYKEKCARWPAEKEKALAAGKPAPPWPSMPKGPDHPNRLSALYNGMLYGITPYTIKGCIWYQGESNAYRAIQYRSLLKDLILDWRKHWGADMPFLMVEICSYQTPQKGPVDPHVYPVARESQRVVAQELDHCDLVCILDLYDLKNPADIHPKNKRDVGQRLAQLALNQVYKQETTYSGPRLASHQIKGDAIILQMSHAEGMRAKDNGELKGFALAGADHKWHWADASISGTTITLRSKHVQKPVAAAYAWAGVPIGNLVNEAGLPAFGFRTDDWARPTQHAVNP